MLAGVLVFGTPAGVLAEDVDHSMEGQISKPQSSGENNADGFVDDSTDNTYGYYTIMRLSGNMRRYDSVEKFLHYLEITTGAKFAVKGRTIFVGK